MSRPGVEVSSAAMAPARGVPTDTGMCFMVGEAAQGPTDRPTRVTSLDEFTATYGARIPGTVSFDSVDAYFHVGGTVLYFQRAIDGAIAATIAATAVAGGGTLDAANEGAWGNNLSLEVVDTPGGATQSGGKGAPQRSLWLTYPEAQVAGAFMATVKVGTQAVQTSQPMDTADELALFLARGSYLRLTGHTAGDPLVAGTVTLAGGLDGIVPVDDPDAIAAAAANIPAELGPGQLIAPGKSDLDSCGALLAAAAVTDRVTLLDGAVTDGTLELLNAAGLLRGALEDRYGSLWGPWAVIPGLAPGTSRVVPWSPVQAALCARVDAAGNPNQAAAGRWGEADYVQSLTQEFSAGDRETLLYAGVNTAATVYGTVQAYGFRTLVDPAGARQEWLELNWARLDMAIKARSRAKGQDWVFSQLDGRGHTISAFGGVLTGVLKDLYDIDALFGDDPTQAFAVNVSPQVNTIDKISDGILSAVMETRMSPHAELVQIVTVKIPVTVALV